MSRDNPTIPRTALPLSAAGLHVGQPALNPLDGRQAVEKSLVGSRVLNDDFGLPVDGQDQGMVGLAQTIEQLDARVRDG